jgi:hypothetical protein
VTDIKEYQISCPYCGKTLDPYLMVGPEGDKKPDAYQCEGCPVLYQGIPEVLAERRLIASLRV